MFDLHIFCRWGNGDEENWNGSFLHLWLHFPLSLFLLGVFMGGKDLVSNDFSPVEHLFTFLAEIDTILTRIGRYFAFYGVFTDYPVGSARIFLFFPIFGFGNKRFALAPAEKRCFFLRAYFSFQFATYPFPLPSYNCIIH